MINFSSLGDKTGDLLKFIFREAKINDALLFFDECESFFESRKRQNSDVTALLTELERHEGLIVILHFFRCSPLLDYGNQQGI